MKLNDGKYEIKREGYRLIVYRYGERWRDLAGDNLIYWMLLEIEKCHADLKDLHTQCRQFDSSKPAEIQHVALRNKIYKAATRIIEEQK